MMSATRPYEDTPDITVIGLRAIGEHIAVMHKGTRPRGGYQLDAWLSVLNADEKRRLAGWLAHIARIELTRAGLADYAPGTSPLGQRRQRRRYLTPRLGYPVAAYITGRTRLACNERYADEIISGIAALCASAAVMTCEGDAGRAWIQWQVQCQ